MKTEDQEVIATAVIADGPEEAPAKSADVTEVKGPWSVTDWWNLVDGSRYPWLIIGRGPTLANIDQVDTSSYRSVALNQVARTRQCYAASIIDYDLIPHEGWEEIAQNANYLLMPWRPHFNFNATDKTLEHLLEENPTLRRLAEERRLIWYNFMGEPREDGLTVEPSSNSGGVLFNLVAQLGARTVHTIGVDGGLSYSPDLEAKTGKKNLPTGNPDYDWQFRTIARSSWQYDVSFEPVGTPVTSVVRGFLREGRELFARLQRAEANVLRLTQEKQKLAENLDSSNERLTNEKAQLQKALEANVERLTAEKQAIQDRLTEVIERERASKQEAINREIERREQAVARERERLGALQARADRLEKARLERDAKIRQQHTAHVAMSAELRMLQKQVASQEKYIHEFVVSREAQMQTEQDCLAKIAQAIATIQPPRGRSVGDFLFAIARRLKPRR